MKKLLAIAVVTLTLVSCSGEKRETAAPAEEKTDMEIMIQRITADQRDTEAWYRLADLYFRSGMYREEADALRKVVAIRPDMGYAYMELGSAYIRLGQYRESIEYFQKARKFFPNNPMLYNNLAVAYGKAGNVDKEITLLKKAIALRPRYATARYNLGMVSLRKGVGSEVLRQYEELKKFDEGAADSLKQELDKASKKRS